MKEETFLLLAESEEVRMGVRSSGTERGIEVLVRPIPPGHSLDIGQIRNVIDHLEALIDLGYEATVHEGSWVVCERTFPEKELGMEVENLLDLFLDLVPRSERTSNGKRTRPSTEPGPGVGINRTSLDTGL